MQTFLPYLGETETPLAYFEECAGLLDQKRLGKPVSYTHLDVYKRQRRTSPA